MLHFDILDDLSDELALSDYYAFMMSNEMTYELGYKIVRLVEYYHILWIDLNPYCITPFMNYVVSHDDLPVIKWLHHNKKENIDSYVLVYACLSRNLEVVCWLFDNYTGPMNDRGKSDLLWVAIEKNNMIATKYLFYELGYRLQPMSHHQFKIYPSGLIDYHYGMVILQKEMLQWFSDNLDSLCKK